MRSLKRIAMAGGLAMLGGAAAVTAAAASMRSPPEAPRHSVLAGLPPVSLGGPCLGSGHAFLRVRIQGSIRLDLDLHGRALSCEGGPRLDGSGVRMGFEGRVRPVGRVRMIFGIDGAREGRPGRELPTNLTVIFEDEKLLFATQGDGSCTVDRLRQEPIGAGHAPTALGPEAAKPDAKATAARARAASSRGARAAAGNRAYRIVAHGFCIAPINDVGGRRRIVVTTFDFAGRADFNSQ
ncbi:MAG TPA: hypothetical protein VND24_09160 [Steroidobacteraceae bacterium]|nr:hypothetical protein [Steroidobacteraceae bacterium]